MRNFLYRTFVEHPQSVDETYFEHFIFAARFSGTLFVAAFAALIHAIIPAACKRTASTRIEVLHRRMHNR